MNMFTSCNCFSGRKAKLLGGQSVKQQMMLDGYSVTLTGALLTDSGSIPDSQKNASNSIESYEYGWRLVLNILNGPEMNIYIEYI